MENRYAEGISLTIITAREDPRSIARFSLIGSSLFQVGRLNWSFPSLRYIISMRFFVVLKPLALLFAD